MAYQHVNQTFECSFQKTFLKTLLELKAWNWLKCITSVLSSRMFFPLDYCNVDCRLQFCRLFIVVCSVVILLTEWIFTFVFSLLCIILNHTFEQQNISSIKNFIHIIIIILARIPEIGQGLGRTLSCAARKPEQTYKDLSLLWTPNQHPFSWHINISLELSAG